jgi:peptidoglycan hydrolase CwlO-like protein
MAEDGEERIGRLERLVESLAILARDASKRLTSLEENVGKIDDRLDKLIQLAISFDERLDSLREAQENSERKLAALADAQIHTEEVVAELAVQQKHTDGRLDALIDIVREMREGNPPPRS